MNKHQIDIFHKDSSLKELERMGELISQPSIDLVKSLFETSKYWVFIYTGDIETENFVVIAECSLINLHYGDKILQISDLYVSEDYLYQGYYTLLLLNILYHFGDNHYILNWDETESVPNPEIVQVFGNPIPLSPKYLGDSFACYEWIPKRV